MKRGEKWDSNKTYAIRAEEFSYQSLGSSITAPIRVNVIDSVAAVHPDPVVSKVLPPSVWWICFTSLRFISSGIPAEANKKTQGHAWPPYHDMSTAVLKPKCRYHCFFIAFSMCSPNTKWLMWYKCFCSS